MPGAESAANDDVESAFADDVEDDSEIPVKTLAGHIASGHADVAAGFKLLEDGSLGRVAVVEDADVDVDEICREDEEREKMEEKEEKKGRGYGKKTATKPFGGTGAWEQG